MLIIKKTLKKITRDKFVNTNKLNINIVFKVI